MLAFNDVASALETRARPVRRTRQNSKTFARYSVLVFESITMFGDIRGNGAFYIFRRVFVNVYMMMGARPRLRVPIDAVMDEDSKKLMNGEERAVAAQRFLLDTKCCSHTDKRCCDGKRRVTSSS